MEAWESHRDPQRDVADQFGVSLGWVENVLRRWHDTGHREAAAFRPAPLPWLSSTGLEQLVLPTPLPPGRNSETACRSGGPRCGGPCSGWIRHGKKSLQASERDTPRVRQL